MARSRRSDAPRAETRRRGGGRRLARAVWPLAVLSASACLGPIDPFVTPPPVAPPAVQLDEPVTEELTDGHLLIPPEAVEDTDEILASPVLRDPEFVAAVDEWVDYWGESAASWVPDFLRRMGRFEATVDSALADREMPESLRYLPFIESGYNPAARSHASAVGMWQFMAVTARGFGMEVTTLVDERRNPYKSTEAAADYLVSLRKEFGSWFLALAAYNTGPTRTRRILRTQAPLAERSDSLFWALRDHFPAETRQFVPKLVGAVLVASAPARHGYSVERDPVFRFDEVFVPDATTLDIVAMAAGTTEEEIVRLNPELIRGITPPGRAFSLRVPEGTGELFATNYALIPPEERVTFVEHVVASGETLSHIAQRYRIRVADLEDANPGIRPRYLRVGAKLTVPIVTGGPRVTGSGG